MFLLADQNFYERLKEIIFNESTLMQRLCYLQSIHADAYLCAGVIRNLVWSALHQQNYPIESGEIDVIFFDANEKEHEISHQIYQKMMEEFPKNTWDVVNQAFVHTWYKTEIGDTISPYLSLLDALKTWPETATAIAVRLTKDNELDVIAPFGLSDLFELKIRWNDRLVSHAVFMHRVVSKQFLVRWKNLKLVS